LEAKDLIIGVFDSGTMPALWQTACGSLDYASQPVELKTNDRIFVVIGQCLRARCDVITGCRPVSAYQQAASPRTMDRVI
jgi:hypothetical protein